MAGHEGLLHQSSPSNGPSSRISGPMARNACWPSSTADYRPRPPDLPASCRFTDGTVAGMPAPRLPHQLHRRAQLRDQRAAELRPCTLWRALMQAGEKYGITPYGTETMHVLRAEKGLHHRRPGDRRHGHAARSRHGLDRQQAEARISSASARCTRPDTARGGPQAAGRPALTDDPSEVIPKAARSSPS